jgi:RNA polymerase sigma factor (sigma-70 family)
VEEASGDVRRAIDAVWRIEAPRLIAGLARLVRDVGAAEELAQDALVTTYRRWPVVRRLERPGDFARKVLVNRHRSLLRRMLVERRHAHADRDEPVTPPAATEDAIVLAAARGRIPARQRLVVVLRYQEDLSEAEVARLLRIPLGTVKTLAHRGLKRLRRELEPSASDFPHPARVKETAR